MLERKKIQSLDDYFLELQKRQNRGVYFYRINGYTEKIGQFIRIYYERARRNGVVIEGKLPNPDEKNLAYYNEIMGMDFLLNQEFIAVRLKKWLPRMNDVQRETVAQSIYDVLVSMKNSGKTEHMLKNAYIKFMCWMYYKFEPVIGRLGENDIPKILYEGEIGKYELFLLSVLSHAGCDIVLLQYDNDCNYQKHDASSLLSDEWKMPQMQPFPSDFSIQKIREDIQAEQRMQHLYGIIPEVQPCTNKWMQGKEFEGIRQSVALRGNDPAFFYNCFLRINGVYDRLTYIQDLFLLQQDIPNEDRNLVIVNGEIKQPTLEEIAVIKRGNYAKTEQLILDLAKNISYTANVQLQRIMHKAFVDVLLEQAEKEGHNLNRLTNQAVYLLCLLKRYQSQLFCNWKMPQVSCFIFLGGCKKEYEAMFLRYLAKLPVDVLILCPNLNVTCCLNDSSLYETNYEESLVVEKYPENGSQIKMGTVAYHAERDLDTLMYEDTGLYRNQQYAKANTVTLQTMYEEIKILWDEEVKYRPGFEVSNQSVNIPVLFSKISGVKNGAVSAYWAFVKELITQDTFVVTKAPYIQPGAANPMKAYAAEFYKNGKLQRNKIKMHPQYPYGILREEMQEFLLDKLESMLTQKLIKGMGENGTEYTVIAQVLHLPKEIVRMIQRFDFTKKNPKLLYINTLETVISLEDSILTAYLNLIGFDILFFVPTGYQNVEKYFSKQQMEEHQIGEYLYDLHVPVLNGNSCSNQHRTWRDKIFNRIK